MTREQAGELLETLRVLWPTSKLPAAGDYRAVEAYKTETAAVFEAYDVADVREVARELARTAEWLPSMAAILAKLEAKQGTQNVKGAKSYQFDEWITDADGYEYVKTYTIVKGPDGRLEVPRPLQKKLQGAALRRELVKRGILTTDDLVRMAKRGELTAEEFITERGADGKPVEGAEKRLDYYTIEPARVYDALSGVIRPANAVLSDKKREEAQDTVYSFFERITADDIPF